MANLLLAGSVVVVAVLAYASSASGRSARGCCAPADPADDVRMHGAFDDTVER